MLEFLLSGQVGEKHLSIRGIVLSGLLYLSYRQVWKDAH